jgi:hypothetical protein
MSVKLFLLSTGERVIAKAQEVVENEGQKRVLGYVFEQPHVVTYDDSKVNTQEDGLMLDITMSPWQILSKTSQIPVTTNLISAIIEPIDSVVQMYMNRLFPEDVAELVEEKTDE